METLQILALQTMSARPTRSGFTDKHLVLLLVGVFSIISIIILCKIFSVLAMKYAVKNKEKIFRTDKKFFEKLQATGKNVVDGNETYNLVINYFRFNRTIRCSNSVVANAANDPLKYLLKYSNITNDEDDLSKIEFIKKFLRLYNVFLEKMEEAKQKAVRELPFFYRIFIKRKKLPYALYDIDYSLAKMKPVCLRFLYVSPAGRVQREHKIEINERILDYMELEISRVINMKSHKKYQRSVMTNDLREAIKKRDNYTCCKCGNSVFKEPNLLLEVDHIIPISKGGKTEADNLQTLCWRCNRAKGDKDNDSL